MSMWKKNWGQNKWFFLEIAVIFKNDWTFENCWKTFEIFKFLEKIWIFWTNLNFLKKLYFLNNCLKVFENFWVFFEKF